MNIRNRLDTLFLILSITFWMIQPNLANARPKNCAFEKRSMITIGLLLLCITQKLTPVPPPPFLSLKLNTDGMGYPYQEFEISFWDSFFGKKDGKIR